MKDWRTVVRLRTSWWHTDKGAFMRKEVLYLKKHSFGWNIIAEDCSQVGFSEVIPRIVNLTTAKDGIYEVVTCNESQDWETGHIDSYDYKLIPFTP